MACAGGIMSTSLQLVLTNEVFELLQQARPDATLHVNALDARGTSQFKKLHLLLNVHSLRCVIQPII